jgi:hypothetical protein
MKHLDYRSLEYAQEDSGICEQFVKINPNRAYGYQVMQNPVKEMAWGNRSCNIEFEAGICNSAMQLERMETLQTKSIPERYRL